MFRLSEKEFNILRSQIVTANPNVSKKRFTPYVFTEQGVSIISNILKRIPKHLKTSIVYTYTMVRQILHYPKLDSILMVEKVIQECKDYPTRMELWRSLPKQMQYQTFKLILEYLETSNKISFHNNKIVWIFANNEKLNKLIDGAVSV